MEEFQNELYLKITAQHKEIEQLRKSYVITSDRYSESLVLLNKLTKHAQNVAKRVKERTKESVLAAITARDKAAKAVDVASIEAKDKASKRTSALAHNLKSYPEAIGFIVASAAKAAVDAEKSAAKASKLVAAAAKELAEAVALAEAEAEAEAVALAEAAKKGL